MSDLTNLSKSLEISLIRTGNYPVPDNTFAISYSGGIIWTQGTIGDTAMNFLSAGGGRLNKKPSDPLNQKEYVYSILKYGNAFQIKADYEGDNVTYIKNPFFIDPVFAASGNPTLSYIKGTYNGITAKTQTGTTTCILALPSIISNTGSSTTPTIALETNNLLSGSLLIHKGNLSGTPFKSNLTGTNNPIVYCSGALPSNDTERLGFATNLANAYSGTSFASNPSIQPFVNALAATNSGTLLTSLGGAVVSGSLGGSNGNSNNNSTTTTQCSPGNYSATGNIPCIAAGTGYYVSSTGAMTQTVCAAGTYQSSTGQSSCSAASAGYYVPST